MQESKQQPNQNQEWYCPLPFRHVFVDSTGISPCCQTHRQQVDLESWHQDPYLLDIQKSFRDNHIHPSCQGCHDAEKAFGRSLRKDALRDYDNVRFDSLEIDFVDYRANNMCNFKCRSCDSIFSNGIAAETRRHPELTQFYISTSSKLVSIDSSNQRWILKNLSRLRRLMFTGGEPTVISEVREIIQHVLEGNYPDLQIMITSNGSFTDDFWQQLTVKHSKLHWTISLDAVDEAATVIRHGTNWHQVKTNVEWLAQHSSSMDINTVVSNLNVLQLIPLLQFVRAQQIASRAPKGRHGDLGIRHQFFVCDNPYHLSATNWPESDRTRVLNYLSHCQTLDLDNEQYQMLETLYDRIASSKFNADQWQHGETLNLMLDRIRGQNHYLLRQFDHV